MKWLSLFITLFFALTGGMLFSLGFSMKGAPGSDIAARSLELKLMGVFFILSPWLSIFFVRRKFSRDRKFAERVRRTGAAKSAVLLSCEETGTYENNSPEVSMVLSVEDGDGTRADRVFRGIVPITRAVLLRPGMELSIIETEEGMVIDWPEAGQGQYAQES